MSRIGKLPVELPEGVSAQLEPNKVTIKGSKGEISVDIMTGFVIEQKENRLQISVPEGNSKLLPYWGMQRSLIYNAVKGVTEGFQKQLEVNGVGFRVTLQGNKLVLSLGFSHPIEYIAPEDIELKVEQNIITVSGVDKQKVGSVAATIREFKKPEPYKGKGIKYRDEHIRRKAGKTAAKTAA